MREAIYLLAYPSKIDPCAAVDQQIRFAQRAVDLGHWGEMHVFQSPQCAAIVITRYRTLTAVSDPHINEWKDTFREVSVGEVLAGLSLGKESKV